MMCQRNNIKDACCNSRKPSRCLVTHTQLHRSIYIYDLAAEKYPYFQVRLLSNAHDRARCLCVVMAFSRVCAFVCAMLKNISSMKPVSNMSFPKL